MPPAPSIEECGVSVPGLREAQRLKTRARLFDAAVAEIGRSGLADADISSIVRAAGVARGTFYFHFPTKEHVLVDLERAEEAKIVAKLNTATVPRDDMASVLTLVVRQILAAERRLGPVLFRDMLGLHFSSTRPVGAQLGEHPLAGFVIAVIAEAQDSGRVPPDADPGQLGVIFMTGLFALLATSGPASRARTALLERYVVTIVDGMETR